MMSTIKEFIFNLTTNSENLEDNQDIDYLNENTIFDDTAADIEFDIEEIISSVTKKKVSIKYPLKTEGVLNKVKNNIYNALLYYWDTPSDTGLMAALLDPRYRELDFIEIEDKRNELIQRLRDEFNELDSNNSNQTIPVAEPSNPNIGVDSSSSLRLQKDYRQRRQSKNKKVCAPATIDEISNYLSMPVASLCKNFSNFITNCSQIPRNSSYIGGK